MDKEEKIKITYLMCTNYSGSTLMAFLMDSHPQIASVGEGLNRKVQRKGAEKYPCSCGELLLNCSFWKQVLQSMASQGYPFNPSHWPTSHKYQNGVLHKVLTSYHSYPFAEWFRLFTTHLLPIHRNRIRDINRQYVAFVRSIIKITDAKNFFDPSKNLMHLYFLLQIPEIDMKFIRITRDLRAFVESYKHRGLSVERGAGTWKKYQLDSDHITRNIPSDKVCFLKYEDLCTDPAYWQEYIYKFLGVDMIQPPETIIPVNHHIIGNRIRLKEKLTVRLNETWRSTLSPTEMSTAYRIAGELNERFGYGD